MKLEIIPDICGTFPEIPPHEIVTSTIAEKINALPPNALITVLTGAGTSEASGIPSFNSKGGIWSRYKKDEVASIESFRDDPTIFWKLFEEMYPTYSMARPSKAHQAIAELGRKRNLIVITQNIDGLHQLAGSEYVIELYGSPRDLVCIECGTRCPLRYDPSNAFSTFPPRCNRKGCSSLLKPDLTFYGEDLSLDKRVDVTSIIKHTDILLAVGTSLRTSHSQQIVFHTMVRGGLVYLFKRHPFYYGYDGQVLGDANETIPQLVDKIISVK